MLGNSNRKVRKAYRLGSHHLKAFENSLEGLCCLQWKFSHSSMPRFGASYCGAMEFFCMMTPCHQMGESLHRQACSATRIS